MFEVRDLSFSYGSKQVLRDISFVVSPGEIVTLVGDNGAGKTTLMRVLASFYEPDGGRILVDGQNALANPLKYRSLIGYLPEEPALYGDMKVREYLVYRARLKGEPEKRLRRRISEAVELCRLSDVLKSRIETLSIGYRKRIALADAILLRPKIVFLDDFMAGLDSTMRLTMGRILASVASFSRVIVTGHELSDLVKWTSQFLVLKNGTIAAALPVAGQNPERIMTRIAQALKGEEAK